MGKPLKISLVAVVLLGVCISSAWANTAQSSDSAQTTQQPKSTEKKAEEKKPEKKGRKQRPHLVKVMLVESASVSDTQLYSGTLKARKLRRVFTEEEGRIIELPYFEGDRIERGALLARLDTRRLKIQLTKAQLELKQTKADVRRLRALQQRGKTGLVAEEELHRAETGLSVAQTEVDLLKVRLGDMRLTAPFSGVLSERLAEVGDVVSRQRHLLTLIDPDSVLAEVHVPAQRLAKLSVGDDAEVRVDALGTQYFKGEIVRIHPVLNAKSRQGVVEIRFEQLPEGVRQGQFCRVRLSQALGTRLSLPYSAVKRDKAGSYVFVLDAENKVQRQAIETGLQWAERVEIVSGLETGQPVVVRGFLGLSAGKTVQVVE